MTTWWWVRHGPTHATEMIGWTDLPADLSDVAALNRLRAYLPREGLLLSSDLTRAAATAQMLQGRHHRPPPDPSLREIHFGEWEGRRWDEAAESHAALSEAFWTTPGDIAAPGGESWNTLRARVDAAVDRVSAAHPGRDIVAVAHFGVILTQLQRALGVTAHEVMAQRIEPLSVTRLALDADGGWSPGEVNHRP